MIINPSQRQLDTRHAKDLVIEVQKSPMYRLYEKFMDWYTGNRPEYVMYKGKQYRSNELIIYSKEEAASMRQEEVAAIVGPQSARYKTTTRATLQGNINRVAISCNGNTIRLDYNDLHMFLQQIQNQYDIAVRDNKQFQYEPVSISKLASFRYKEDVYEFVNGFILEFNIVKDIDTKKYTALEPALNIELREQYDTAEQAEEALKKAVSIRLKLIEEKENADMLFKHIKIEAKPMKVAIHSEAKRSIHEMVDAIKNGPLGEEVSKAVAQGKEKRSLDEMIDILKEEPTNEDVKKAGNPYRITNEALEAMDKGAEDIYTNICINCGKEYIGLGKEPGKCQECLDKESKKNSIK